MQSASGTPLAASPGACGPSPNNLHFVLANLGVPSDALRAPLPPEGPRGLLKYIKAVN